MGSSSLLGGVQVKRTIARPTPDSWVRAAGRRSFLEYRNLGVAEATGGRMSFEIGRAPGGCEDASTGWHYHTCDISLTYLLNGGAEMGLAGGGVLHRADLGSFGICPPGRPHNELRLFKAHEFLEFVVGKMGTVACEEPTPDFVSHVDSPIKPSRHALGPDSWQAGQGRQACMEVRDFGVAALPDGTISAQAARVKRGMKSPASGWQKYDCELRVIYVFDGWIDVEYEGGVVERYDAGTCYCDPPGTRHNELRMSDDYHYLEIVVGDKKAVAF